MSILYMHACRLSDFNRVQLFVTLWTVALRAPLSIGFSKQEHSSGLPRPPPGDLLYPGIKSASLMHPALAGSFFTSSATWETHLFIFAFISFALGDGSKNKAIVIYVKKCSAQVFIQKFCIFNLTHRSQIHFEFVFVYSVR